MERSCGKGVGRARKWCWPTRVAIDTASASLSARGVVVSRVITFAADLGQGDELEPDPSQGPRSRRSQSLVGDLFEPFITEFAFPPFGANPSMRVAIPSPQPWPAALDRPELGGRWLAGGRDAVAHGCTGKATTGPLATWRRLPGADFNGAHPRPRSGV